MRIGKCKRCKKEFKSTDKWWDIYSYPFQTWFKLCPACYDLEVEKGSIKLCNIDACPWNCPCLGECSGCPIDGRHEKNYTGVNKCRRAPNCK